MFTGRKKLERRDQEAGLAFSWRVPVSSTMAFVWAMVIVFLVALGLAAAVRIRIGSPATEDSERGTLVLVPKHAGGASMERRAIEAGPFPVRWNPAADPEYAAMRRDALRSASDIGIPYQPQLAGSELESRMDDRVGDPLDLVFPPLPESRELTATKVPRSVTIGARVIQEGSLELQFAKLSLAAADASDAAGWKFMLQYDEDGRILEVTEIDSRGRKETLIHWLARARVTGNKGKSGWLIVESVIQS